MASASLAKDKRVNIRISSRDLNDIQAKAAEEAIPYQTLMSSVLHKYVTGRLVEPQTSLTFERDWLRQPLNLTLGVKITISVRWRAFLEIPMNFTIEHEREEDGRWLAEVPEIPGALAYGTTANEAMAKAEILALRVIAERLEHDESGPQSISIAVAAA